MSPSQESKAAGVEGARTVGWAAYVAHTMLDDIGRETFKDILLMYGISIDLTALTRAFDNREKPNTSKPE